ncbi:hypothetical protein SAMN05421504_101153 [Amycolatopsis xylanica]|uniref:Uncharacterized protein n=1 Tax=Amycolatopsis xylanica TaxID=589385 RepID=A0A1H2SB61_9PSEU|nr:DUF4440 domain-containing protein [Amycolatopsis xylanica]SDW28344.1 hypothetical protein SAMN05421504_101153 [Amycolatopsis xylanica]
MEDRIEAEVVRQHDLLAAWLGSRAEDSVLADLRAAHTADFMLVTVSGEVLDREALLTALAGAANAQPGLRIEIAEVVIVARLDDAVLVRFLETHVLGEQRTARRVSALLRPGGWAYVHETAVG